ncbi:MAG: hypothetical protein IJT98_02105 [Prevotella sp.]|nr:hypothetical protein [Prevotella sp.]
MDHPPLPKPAAQTGIGSSLHHRAATEDAVKKQLSRGRDKLKEKLTFHVQTGFLLWLTENFRLIATTLLSLLMTLGIISIISNVQDIWQMRGRVKATHNSSFSTKKIG